VRAKEERESKREQKRESKRERERERERLWVPLPSGAAFKKPSIPQPAAGDAPAVWRLLICMSDVKRTPHHMTGRRWCRFTPLYTTLHYFPS